MFGWRLVCLLAAGFAVATTWVQADQRPQSAGLLVLAADAQVDAKADPKADVKTDGKPTAKTDGMADAKAKAPTIDERVAMWLKTCLQDWDTATHMSKEQWRTTCERVSKDRGKFLSETPASLSLSGKR